MSLTVEIPESMQQQLQQWAEAAQVPQDDVVLRALQAYLAVPPDLREELDGWQQLGAASLERVAPIENETW